MNASEAGHAYRLGLMGPKSAAEYEDAVRMGIVQDRYAHARIFARSPAGVANAATSAIGRAVPFLSEAQAGADALGETVGDALSGRPVDIARRFKAVRDTQQGTADELKAGHPVLSGAGAALGYGGQMAGALATGGATEAPAITEAVAPGLKALAGRVAGRTARNSLIGGGYAAVNSAARPGTLLERAQAASQAIPGGIVLGATLPAAFAGGKYLATRAIPGVARRAGAVASEIADAGGRFLTGKLPADQAMTISPEAAARGQTAALDYLRQVGATPAGLRQAVLDANGKPISTAEAIGPSAITLSTGISRRAGTTAALADARMQGRASDRANRVLADITDATGIDPSAARGHVETLVQQGRDMAKPLFDQIRAIPGPIMSPELQAWANTPIGKKTIASTVQSMKNVPGANPLEHGLPVDPDSGAVGSSTPGALDQMQLQPTAHAWDAIRNRMSQMVERDQFGKPIPDSIHPGNYDLNQSRAFLTNALAGDGKTNPGLIAGYRDALDQSGDYLSIDRAYKNATGKLFGRSKDADPTTFAKWYSTLTPIEQHAAKAGGANDVLTGLQNGTLRPGTFALPHVRMKLSTLYGEDAADKLTTALDAEARMAAAEARMRPNLNSVTPDLMGSEQDQSDASGSAALDAAGHILLGRPGRAVRSLAGGLSPYMSAARKPLDQASRNALGELLYGDPADAAHLLELQQKATGVFAPPPQALPPPLVALTGIEAGRPQNQ